MNSKRLFFLTIIISAIFSCSKDEIIEDVVNPKLSSVNVLAEFSENSRQQSGIQEIVHNYNYYGKEFTVIYDFDIETDRVVNVSGDVEFAKVLFSNEETQPQGFLYDNIKEDGTTIYIRVFDTNKELDEYVDNTYKGKEKDDAVLLDPCWYVNVIDPQGSGFYFFEHSFYRSEMVGARKLPSKFFKDGTLGGIYSGGNGGVYNDLLSSLIVIKNPNFNYVAVALYEDTCYRGRNLLFISADTFGIGNLKHYTAYKNFIFWSVSWNDLVSSTAGITWN